MTQPVQEWQLVEIEAGLAEADRGEFASPAEVAQVVAKHVQGCNIAPAACCAEAGPGLTRP